MWQKKYSNLDYSKNVAIPFGSYFFGYWNSYCNSQDLYLFENVPIFEKIKYKMKNTVEGFINVEGYIYSHKS